MKRIVLSLALIVLLVTPIMAADSSVKGVYGGVKFIDSIQSTGSIHKKGTLREFVDFDSYTQNSVGGGAFLGFDFFPQFEAPFRAEIEYAVRTNTRHAWNADIAAARVKGEWNVQTLMANLYYDLRNTSDFTPYIGAGLGMGFIGSRYKWQMDGVGSEEQSSLDTVFAWNVGAGCSYAFTENVSADLGYRFLSLGYHKNSKTIGGERQEIGMSPYANEISLGLRFTF